MKKTLSIVLFVTTISSNAQLKKLFDRESLYGHFSGAVLVEKKDSILFEYSNGEASETNPITQSTTFDIGSITKQFTAAAILHLVQEGKLDLQDLINPLLCEHANDKWDKVTVHQLLTHTSGIPSLYQTEQGLEIFFPEARVVERGDLLSRFKDGKLLFSPGEEFSYSNSGYILLAVIIEKLSGEQYENYMLDMFETYGLNETFFQPNETSALPYYGYRKDLIREAKKNHSSWYVGCGGIYSTVNDLCHWIDVISSDSFLTSDLRDKYLKAHTSKGYGYGWVHTDGMIYHDGGNSGFISQLSFNPETNEKVIILTNRSFEPVHMFDKSASYVKELVDKCWASLNGEEIEVLPNIKALNELNLEEISPYEQGIRIEKNDTSVLVLMNGKNPGRILYNSPLFGSNELEAKMVDIAEYLEKKKYWSLAKYCDGEMKFVCYSGMMSIGMRMLKKQIGGSDQFIPYYVEQGHGLIRMKGPDGILDLVVYFDEEGDVQGIFEHGYSTVDSELAMVAYPIGNSFYYLDGLPYGEKSATLKITPNEFTVYQIKRSISFKRAAN